MGFALVLRVGRNCDGVDGQQSAFGRDAVLNTAIGLCLRLHRIAGESKHHAQFSGGQIVDVAIGRNHLDDTAHFVEDTSCGRQRGFAVPFRYTTSNGSERDDIGRGVFDADTA